MPRVEKFDEATDFDLQMAEEGGPVTLINHVSADPADESRLRQLWAREVDFFERQPGHMSTALYKGVAGSQSYVEISVWEDTASLRAAFTHPEFQARLADYPESPVARPHILRKLDLDGS